MKSAVIAAYLLGALGAFGHAYHRGPGGVDTRVVGATVCAIAWPLYLSVQLQKETL